MSDWGPPKPSEVHQFKGHAPSNLRSLGRRVWVRYFPLLCLIPIIVGVLTTIQLFSLMGDSRTSVVANRQAVELESHSSSALAFMLIATSIWLLILRRRLKKGVIKRFKLRWYRIFLGLYLIPFLYFWARDIEQLLQVPRKKWLTTSEIRKQKTTLNGLSLTLMSVTTIYVSQQLNYAALGLDYVTVGTAGIDDPLRYLLKYIDPERITSSLDKYSSLIWPASLASSILSIAAGILLWRFTWKVTKTISEYEVVA
jgi:hypothetical protein